jgi:hypothetical protein
LGGDTWAAILDRQPDRVGTALKADLGDATIFHGVVDQVGQRPPKRYRTTGEAQSIRLQVVDRLAHISNVIAERTHQGSEVHVLARLAGAVVPSEGQGLVEHGRHGVEIGDRLALLLGVVDQLGAQPQTGEYRAQIVGDGSEHARAVVDEALDALLHLIERPCRLEDLARPGLGHRRGIYIGAKSACGLGEATERHGHPPRRPDREQRDAAGQHREAKTEA